MTQSVLDASDALWREVRAEFGYDLARDAASANLLRDFLSRPGYKAGDVVEAARTLVGGREVWVVGAADSAASGLAKVPSDAVIVAADGATTAVLEAGLQPVLIVTDLDGNVRHEIRAAERGSYVFAHSHGDNLPALQRWFPRFPKDQVAGTCQTPPEPPLINPGGFTDGDRACYLSQWLGATRLHLVGFELGGPVGRYSGRPDPATKLRKLAWADRFLKQLVAQGVRID